jgi:membrane protein required for colicin V production
MNYIDIILAIPIIWAIYRGFTKGFIIEIASLIAMVLGVYGAIHFSYFIANLLNLHSSHAPLISFAVTFLIIVIVIFLFAKMLEKSLNLLALGFLNKLAGAFFSLLKIAFIISILLIFVNKLDAKISIVPEKTRKESLLYPPISAFAPLIIPKLNFEEIEKTMVEPSVKNDSLK